MWHNIKQPSEEWLSLRAGLITSTGLAKVMANFGKAFGEPAKKYAVDLALEQITGVPVSSDYSNSHMQRGNEEEPIARMLYEDTFFSTVTNGGFFEDGTFGTSPDGLIGDDGMIEIKSAIPSIHYSRLVSGSFDAAYKWQLVHHLKVSGRDWIDFCSYCSSFPEDKRLFVKKVYKQDFSKEFEMVDQRMAEFLPLVNQTKENILSKEYSL